MTKTTPEPLTTVGMVAVVINDRTGRTVEIAIAPGLTHDEAVASLAPYLGPDGRVGGFTNYSFVRDR